MSIRKQGIAFSPSVSLSQSQTGLADTFSGKYRLEGTTGDWTSFPNKFVEVTPGFYQTTLTITAVGVYDVVMESTNQNVSTVHTKVVIVAATTDDIAAALTAAQGDITSILTKVNTLDDKVLADINTAVTDVDTKLADLKTMLSSEEEPAINTLRDLLQQITAAGTSRDSVISALTSYTVDIENILNGSKTLKDGSPNPFYGKTTHDVYDRINGIESEILAAIRLVQTYVSESLGTTNNLIKGSTDSIINAIKSNNDVLTGNDGLAAIHTAVTAVQAALDTDSKSAADQFTAVINSLNGLNTSITSFNSTIENKLDSIATKIDGVAATQANTWTARAVM
ncbi:MAG: hypothetical protein JHC33_00155 [Ignisphaera sp.]|nr:hypothetical protein [Ignisphaera sp.]